MGDQPAFWLPALLGTALAEIAMQEWLARKYVSTFCFFAWALIAFAFAIYSAVNNWTTFVLALHAPPLVPFIIAAIIITISSAVFSEYRRDLLLKEKATTLALDLNRFIDQCAAWAIAANLMSGGDQSTEARRQYKTFTERYEPRIIALDIEFTRYSLAVEPRAAEFLGTFIRPFLRIVLSNSVEAIDQWARSLPQPARWFRRLAFYLRIVLLMIFFSAFWIALSLIHHSLAA